MSLKIRREKPDIDSEKELVTAMIVSDEFLTNIIPVFDRLLLGSQPARIVTKWVTDYFDEFGKAPKRTIQRLFLENTQEVNEDAQAQLESYLSSLSLDFQNTEFDLDHALANARVFLKERRLLNLSESIRALVNDGEVLEAEETLLDYKSVLLTETDDSNTVVVDKDSLRRSLDDDFEVPLIKLPGEIGRYLNQDFTPSSFVAFQAPEKRGKSWLLTELAFRGWIQGHNVFFIALGDMSIEQVQKRLLMRFAKNKTRYPSENVYHFVPVLDCKKNQEDDCSLPHRISKETKIHFQDPKGEIQAERRPCTECLRERKFRRHFSGTCLYKKTKSNGVLDDSDVVEFDNFKKLAGRAKIFLSAYSSEQINVRDLIAKIDELEHGHETTIPIIIIDYADNLATEPGVLASNGNRDKEHARWRALRGLSLSKNKLVVTATQADVNAQFVLSQTLNNFSEDKRKAGQVTALYAINQTVSERMEGKFRIGTLCRREGEVNEDKQVTILRHLPFGKPMIASYETYVSQAFGKGRNEK